MAKQSVLLRRFTELTEQMTPIEASKRHEKNDFFDGNLIDNDQLLSWQVKVRNLLSMACGKESEHYKEFIAQEGSKRYRDQYQKFKDLCAVFFAAREDYEGGYISSLRNLIQAELYDDELEQSEGNCSRGWLAPA